MPALPETSQHEGFLREDLTGAGVGMAVLSSTHWYGKFILPVFGHKKSPPFIFPVLVETEKGSDFLALE